MSVRPRYATVVKAAVLAFVALQTTARAHDMWLVPSSFAPPADAPLEIALRIGHAGSAEPVLRDGRRIVRFEAVGADAVSPILGLDGGDPAGFLRPDGSGLLIVVYESTTAFSELPPERFAGYAEEEGLESVLALRRRLGEHGRPGRELFSRSLKSLIRVGETSDPPDRMVGLPLEMMLEDAEAAAAQDAPMAVRIRLLFDGAPLADALIDVVSLDTPGGTSQQARTDAEGRLSLSLASGAWMASGVHAVRTQGADAARAEWRTFFGSLTFALPVAAGGAGR